MHNAEALRHQRQPVTRAQIADIAFVTAGPGAHVPDAYRQPFKRICRWIIAVAEPAEHVRETIAGAPAFVLHVNAIEQTRNTCKADFSRLY